MNGNEIKIVRYEDRYCEAFRRLNEEWITKYFQIESEDIRIFSSPRDAIINHDGEIFIALDGSTPIGTIAIKACATAGYDYEIEKFAVSSASQGKGAGKKLMRAAMEEIARRGGKSVLIITNSTLLAAIHIYEKFGFRHIDAENSDFARGNYIMEAFL